MERTILYFENERKDCLYNAQVLHVIRQMYPDAFVTVVSAGHFTDDGSLIEMSSEKRSEEYERCGADLILSLPAASSLGGYGQKELAGAALVQRLRVPEKIIIPCTANAGQTLEECEKALRSYAMLMFKEQPDYRASLKRYLDQDMSFRDAQVRAVCDVVPDAASVLSCPENRAALWLLFAFLQLYYMAKTQFIPAPACTSGCTDPAGKGLFEKTAAAKLKEVLSASTTESLIDISGSTPSMAEALKQKEDEIFSLESLEEIARLMPPGSQERTTLFLLKAILGVRKIYMQISALHEYVPYCHISAVKAAKSGQFRQMAEKTWVPFVGDHDPQEKVEKDYSYLLLIDQKAASLCSPASRLS